MIKFMGIITTPVIGKLNLQKESKELAEGKSTVAYLFNNEYSANKFMNAVAQYVKNTEVVSCNEVNEFKVRLQLNKDKKNKNKNTMKVVSLAQWNCGKIDIHENGFLDDLVNTIFVPHKLRGLKRWSKDSEDAVDKAKENDEDDDDDGEKDVSIKI